MAQRFQAETALFKHATGSGTQKFGHYWWAWNTADIPPNETPTPVDANCPGGPEDVPLGGGYAISENRHDVNLTILGSQPFDSESVLGWEVTGWNPYSSYGSISLEVWVICAKVK